MTNDVQCYLYAIPDWLRTCCLLSNCHAVKYYIVCIYISYIFTVFKNCCPRTLILQTYYPHSFSSLLFMKSPSPFFFYSVQHWLSLNKNNFIWCLILMTNTKILLFVFNWYGSRGSTPVSQGLSPLKLIWWWCDYLSG